MGKMTVYRWGNCLRDIEMELNSNGNLVKVSDEYLGKRTVDKTGT